MNPSDDVWQILSQEDFCRLLERNITARMFLSFRHGHGLFLHKKTQVLRRILQAGPGKSLASVLRDYELTPKDKILLSYAIARSYWQYYDSILMRSRWTSDTIWFMSDTDSGSHGGLLPLCAYLPFPFDVSGNNTPHLESAGLLNHRCPRIFDIGVLLLEIGLAKPFRTGKRRDVVSQANLNHKIATDQLLELEKTDWDGFTYKKYFDQAVRFCFNSENFIPPSKQPKTTRQGVVLPARPAIELDWQAGVLTQRKIFHKNVVRPLTWLAKRGFKAQVGDITYVNRKRRPSCQGGASDTLRQLEPEALFNGAISPKMWLRDLKKIYEHVEHKRRECRVKTPVRVAILDTGLNMDLPVFKARSGLIMSITDKVDLVDPRAPTMMDSFGHGTFMARLIMECVPGAEILVARVAENTSELERSQENIKEVSEATASPLKFETNITGRAGHPLGWAGRQRRHYFDVVWPPKRRSRHMRGH